MSMTLQATETAAYQASPAVQSPNPLAAIIPQVTSSLQQLAPAIAETQVNMQNLLAKVTAALEASEKRNRELEARLAAEEAARKADNLAHKAELDSLKSLFATDHADRIALGKDIAALKDQTKYIRPAFKMLAATGGPFLELDYPGKAEDVAQRKPILEAELAKVRLAIKQELEIPAKMRRHHIPTLESRARSLEMEARRLAVFEAREGKTQEPPCP